MAHIHDKLKALALKPILSLRQSLKGTVNDQNNDERRNKSPERQRNARIATPAR